LTVNCAPRKKASPAQLLVVCVLLALLVATAWPLADPGAVQAVAPVKPVNESPVNGAIEISRTHTLRSSAFSDEDDHLHYASRWQITNISGDYSSPVFDSGVTTSNKVSLTIPHGILYTNTTYYWRVQYIDGAGERSDWSDETSFTTIASAKPITPVNGQPINGAVDMALNPTLTASPFASPDGGATHGASRWQIASDSAFAAVIHDSGTDTTHKTSITVALGTLCSSTTYYWRVRYQDNYGEWSEWSAATCFTTASGVIQPEASAPNRPVNTAPVDGAEDIILTTELRASAFGPDTSEHNASRWQITTTPGDYETAVWDSGVDVSELTEIRVPSGVLSYATVYYWRVRYQDSFGRWSPWSVETSFTTLPPLPPNGPSNITPSNGATAISLTPYLESSEFSDPDVEDTHSASRWQIATDMLFDEVIFDTHEDTSNLVRLPVPPNVLDYSTQYYWRVKYRDRYGMWSAWSLETSFTTVASQPPRQPANIAPADEAANIASLTLTLQASAFSDPDVRDTHVATWWQITNISANYSAPVYDSGTDTRNLTQLTIPAGVLQYGATYYWRVSYQDRYGNWSAWSEETCFSTVALQANFSATPTEVEVGQEVTFTDLSTGHATRWTWDFGDGTTVQWTANTKSEDGRLTWKYHEAGNYTVSLTVSGPSGEATKTRSGYIKVSEATGGGGVPFYTWIATGLLIILAGSLAAVRLRRR